MPEGSSGFAEQLQPEGAVTDPLEIVPGALIEKSAVAFPIPRDRVKTVSSVAVVGSAPVSVRLAVPLIFPRFAVGVGVGVGVGAGVRTGTAMGNGVLAGAGPRAGAGVAKRGSVITGVAASSGSAGSGGSASEATRVGDWSRDGAGVGRADPVVCICAS
jgi:hypothetical protein